MTTQKLPWQGVIISVQPRIHLVRSFDQRQHEYLGFALRLHGTIDGQDREFFIGIGKATQTKQGFRVGDRVSGESVPVLRADRDSVEFYKTSKLKRLEPAQTLRPNRRRGPESHRIYRPIDNGVIVGSMREPMPVDVRPVSGVAGCRW